MLLLKNLQNILKAKNVKVRTRLLQAGVILGLGALAIPYFINLYNGQLLNLSQKKSEQWHLLYKIQEFNKELSKSEAYLEKFDETNLQHIDRIYEDIDATIHNNKIDSKANFKKAYKHWRETATLAPTQSRRDSVLLLQTYSNTLDKILKIQLDEIETKFVTYTRRAKFFTIYGGSAFFLGFIAFILSLWFVLIPDFSNLLHATREVHKGNLGFRASISGKTETAELASAFNEMAASIAEQKEKLQELSHLKTDFVATVSHELRTPLTVIKGALGLLTNGILGDIPKDAKNMLAITERNTDRLIRLINDVLDISKIEAGGMRLKLQKYSLSEIIEHAVESTASLARAREINLSIQKSVLDPIVVADRDRIEQILVNLISNSIKFTDGGGSVNISYELKDQEIVVVVDDSGKGIPDEFKERLFQKFQQVESSVYKANEGTGLGLAIVKGLVEEHGGRVWVDSKTEAGTKFSFSLPWNGQLSETQKAA